MLRALTMGAARRAHDRKRRNFNLLIHAVATVASNTHIWSDLKATSYQALQHSCAHGCLSAEINSCKMAWRRFATAGLVPGSLVGWELFAYGKQRQKFDDAKKVRPKPLVEGSTAWLIERDARTLDLVCVRHRALDRGPAAALADAAARVDEAYPYDGVGVVVVERDGVSRVLRADLTGTVTACLLYTSPSPRDS